MLQIIFGKQKKKLSLFFLKSRREDYEISPQFRTQMGDGYDFFASAQNRKVQQKRNLSRFLYCFTSTKILTRSRHPG